jgi:hypothetical protein
MMKVCWRKDARHQIFWNAVTLEIMLPTFTINITEKKYIKSKHGFIF